MFYLLFPETGFDISCSGDNLHEMSDPVFWGKISSICHLQKFAKRVAMVNSSYADVGPESKN